MLRQDYIIRQIEMLIRAIARLLRLLREEPKAQLGQEIDSGLRNMSGLSLDLVRTLSLRGLLEMVRSGEHTDVFRALAVAELLNIHQEVCRRQGDNNGALMARVKALTLYLEALISFRHSAAAAAEARTEALIDELAELELPPETMIRLCRYYVVTGRFARAEDVLFEMIEAGSGGPETITEGIAIYEELLARDDTELEAGSLPRDEVEEGLAALRARAPAVANG